ncbi:MAG: glycosyltransferase family 4 protein [Acidobacteriota bacterium]
MRILLMIDWNRGRGGAEAYAAALRDGLLAAGDEVRLLTSSAGTAGDGAAEYVAYGTENRIQQSLLQIVNPFAAATVRRAVREFQPDIAWINMFAHHLSPAALLALGDLPKVLLVSDYKIICPVGSKLLPDGSLCRRPAGWVCHQAGCVSIPHWLRDQPRYAFIRSAVKRVDRVLGCSRWVNAELANAGIHSELMYLPVPAPPQNFERVPSPDPLFLFCGRLDVEKGLLVLLQAFARLNRDFPRARLRIAGQGPERTRLEHLAASLKIGSSVEFLGWKTRREMEPLLSEAWASVAPSLWAEPQGLVALEAIVRCVPVIASSSGGLGEMIEHGINGLLFPNGDEDALLNNLRAIASGVAFPERSLSQEVAQRTLADFSTESHIERLRQVFSATIRDKR